MIVERDRHGDAVALISEARWVVQREALRVVVDARHEAAEDFVADQAGRGAAFHGGERIQRQHVEVLVLEERVPDLDSGDLSDADVDFLLAYTAALDLAAHREAELTRELGCDHVDATGVDEQCQRASRELHLREDAVRDAELARRRRAGRASPRTRSGSQRSRAS